jgi:hypothetical protein
MRWASAPSGRETIMCNKEASYYVPRGYDYKEIKTTCGSTAYQNGYVTTVFCDDCLDDHQVQAEHETRLEAADEDNAWLRSAGWGEI